MQLILGSWLNMLGAVLRFCGTLLGRSYLFPVVMLGQTLGALAQPLIIFTPTKQVALWFPDHQRATANTIATMCEFIGSASWQQGGRARKPNVFCPKRTLTAASNICSDLN